MGINTHKTTFVICDNSIISQYMVINFLKPCFDVIGVRNVDELKTILSEQKIQLVIAEWIETDATSWKDLSMSLQERKQPWIAITSMPKSKSMLEEFGFNAYLTKPMDMDELKVMIMVQLNCTKHERDICKCLAEI